MPKKNADLIGETAGVLLNEIKKHAGNCTQPDQLRALAEAFSTVAAADQQVSSGGRSGAVH
ncbi:hypothetical protein ACFP6A_11530 [Quadrisphaera sp. GCM10027208]|uniref:hypothetical protein n=1 Tax=Quadrisphaera sp. GCM10027208 TaxID=3273423 RepID=UPI00360EF232